MPNQTEIYLYENEVVRSDVDEIIASVGENADRLAGRTVLITGAYGMLASYLVYTLLGINDRWAARGKSERINVCALGRSPGRMRQRFGPLLERPDLIEISGDVVSYAARLSSGNDSGIDYMIHAASPTDPRSYLTDPDRVINANVTATDALLKAAVRMACRGFLFISSGEVYGRLQKDVITEEDGGLVAIGEKRSVYAMSKKLGEILCEETAARTGLRAMAARPSHTYGPPMDIRSDSRVFASFMRDASAGKDIVMTSDGTATRAFTYLTDATAGYLTILLKGEAGAAYNVTNNDGIRSIRQLAGLIAGQASELYGTPVGVVSGFPEETYKENANRTACVRSTARLEALGWKARVSPEEGFERTLRSFLA